MNLLEIIHRARVKYLQEKGKYPTHILLTDNQFHLLLQDGAIDTGILSMKNKNEYAYRLMGMCIIFDRQNLTMGGQKLIMLYDEGAFWLPSDFHDKPLKLYDDTIPLWSKLFNGANKCTG